MTAFSRRRFLHTGGTAAVAATLAGVPTGARAQESVTWSIETLWQPGTANQEAFTRFAEHVALMTNGQVNITPLPAGAVVGVNEMLDAVSQGILGGMHPATVYWTGRNPAFAAIGDLNAAYDTPYQAMEWFYKYDGHALLKEAYEPLGIYPIGAAWWGVESIPTTRKVAKPSDLEGLKIRLPQGMASDLFSKFGAVPVNLPGSEVFSAMDNGTIEATDWGTLAMNEELGFHDVAKFAIYPGVHSMPMGDVSIPLSVWKSLDPDVQRLLELAVQNFGLDMVQTLDKQNLERADKLRDEGVELVDWSDESRKEFRQAAVKVWDTYAGKNDLTKRAVESQKSFLRQIGLLG